MKRFLVRLASCFIPDKRRRKLFRQRMLQHAEVPVVQGEGNEIVNCPPGVKVFVYGNGNRVEFREPVGFFRGLFMIGTSECPVNGTRVTVGERTSCQYVTVWVLEDGSTVSIGRDCMISKDVEIWSTDAHSIFDADGRLLNGGAHTVTVGDHCWLGFRSCLLKGSCLDEGVIVGMGAVVAGSKPLIAHGVYVGNPARLVKENVRWTEDAPQKWTNGREART